MASLGTETFTSLVPVNVTEWLPGSADSSSSSSSSSYADDGDGEDSEQRLAGILIGSVYLLITAVGVAGNGTVIFVVLRFAKMKTVTNCYILNLAVADALFLTALVFLAVCSLLDNRWIFGALLCKLVFGVDGINMFISIFCLTAMSVDRYVAVCHAMKSRSFRNLRVATAVNSGIWVLSVLAAIPIPHFTQYHADDPSCYMTFQPERAMITSRYLIVYFFAVGFVLPVVVITVCYASIMLRLRDMNKKTGKPEKSRKVNRMVMVVIVTFVLCWSPFYLCRFLFVFWEGFRRWSGGWIAMEIAMALSYINSCANPLLYAFLSDNFRKSFQRAWCCGTGGRSDLTLVSHASRWKFGKGGGGGGGGGSGRGKPKRRRGRFRLRNDDADDGEEDDDQISGVNNQYPLTATAVTSAISESTYPRNGELANVQMERQGNAIA